MPVVSQEIAERRVERPLITGVQVALIGAGLISLALGSASWIVGAWYSLRGWVLGLNLVLGIVTASARVPMPSSWWIGLLLPLGLAYSFAEVQLRPRRALYKKLAEALGWQLMIFFFVLYVFLISTDFGSTFLSVISPPPDAWDLTKWAAATPWAAGGWTAILTFCPEGFIILGIVLLRKGWTWNT